MGEEGAAPLRAWWEGQGGAGAGKLRVLVEGYAPWCPHCQRFRPEYEKVAKMFNEAGGMGAGSGVLVAHVDCTKHHSACTRLGVEYFPAMFWCPPEALDRYLTDPTSKRQKSSRPGLRGGHPDDDDCIFVEAPHTAQHTLDWVNARLGAHYTLLGPEPQKGATVRQGPGTPSRSLTPVAGMEAAPLSTPGMADLEDMKLAVELSILVIGEVGLHEGDPEALKDWLSLIELSHPSPQCRAGARSLIDGHTFSDREIIPQIVRQVGLGELCPAGARPGGVHGRPVAPREVSFEGATWGVCKGMAPGTRGFTCGLWMALHAMSVNCSILEGPDRGSGGAEVLRRVKGFIEHFFACDVCRTHFLQMTQEAAFREAQTPRQAVLWLWRAHNIVNDRLGREEAAEAESSGTPNPNPAKVQFPTNEQCPECFSPSKGYDERAVFNFLQRIYGVWPIPKSEPRAVLTRSGSQNSAGVAVGRLKYGGSQGHMGGVREPFAVWVLVGLATTGGVLWWAKKKLLSRREIKAELGYDV